MEKAFLIGEMQMAMTTAQRRAKKDSYLQLVKKFPLKTLKSDADHDCACEMIDHLMGRDLDPGADDDLDASMCF